MESGGSICKRKYGDETKRVERMDGKKGEKDKDSNSGWFKREKWR